MVRMFGGSGSGTWGRMSSTIRPSSMSASDVDTPSRSYETTSDRMAQLKYLFKREEDLQSADVKFNKYTLRFDEKGKETEFLFRRWVRLRPRWNFVVGLAMLYFAQQIVFAENATFMVLSALAAVIGICLFVWVRLKGPSKLRHAMLSLMYVLLTVLLWARVSNEIESAPWNLFLIFTLVMFYFRTTFPDMVVFAVFVSVSFPLSMVAYARASYFVIVALVVWVTVVSLVVVAYKSDGRDRRAFVLTVHLRHQHSALNKEKAKVDLLLHNIFPKAIADRMDIHTDNTFSETYEDCTVLLCDVVGFTSMSASLPADQIVRMLNLIFGQFDRLVKKYRLEKIKTIGDAYLVVGGCPIPQPDTAMLVVHLALDMMEAVTQLSIKEQRKIQIRIGICTGTVQAGIIGIVKRTYDIFGPAVDRTFELEPTSQPMRINVSDTTYNAVKSKFVCEHRGLIKMQDGSEMRMYFVNDRLETPPSRKAIDNMNSTHLSSVLTTNKQSGVAHFLMSSPPLQKVMQDEAQRDNTRHNKYTLRFRDKTVEDAFLADVITQTTSETQYWIGCALVFQIGFFYTDVAILEGPAGPYMFMVYARLVSVLLLSINLYLTRYAPPYERRPAFVAFGLLVAHVVVAVGKLIPLAAVSFEKESIVGDLATFDPDETENNAVLASEIYACEFFIATMSVAFYARAIFVHKLPVLFGALLLVSTAWGVGFYDGAVWTALYYAPYTILVSVGAYFMEYSTRSVFLRQKAEIEKSIALEDQVSFSSGLITSILPTAVYERLKVQPGAFAEEYTSVSVLFATICGFDKLTARLTPHETINVLNTIYTKFDQLADSFQIEKIKTFGGTYMCAGGISDEPDPDHLERLAGLALAMIQTAQSLQIDEVNEPIEIKIGINVGSVVCGVIGESKFSFDTWGDAVNFASRMMSTGMPGKIQLTPTANRMLAHAFETKRRGTVQVKGKGAVEVFFLQKTLSASARGAAPKFLPASSSATPTAGAPARAESPSLTIEHQTEFPTKRSINIFDQAINPATLAKPAAPLFSEEDVPEARIAIDDDDAADDDGDENKGGEGGEEEHPQPLATPPSKSKLPPISGKATPS